MSFPPVFSALVVLCQTLSFIAVARGRESLPFLLVDTRLIVDESTTVMHVVYQVSIQWLSDHEAGMTTIVLVVIIINSRD